MSHIHPTRQNKILQQAKQLCSQHKERLTKPRFEVLCILAASPTPLGAYQILEELRKTIKDPKPPTVYRAIEFWRKLGFVHRIESLNAYMVCHAKHLHTGEQFLICDDCGTVIETHICGLPKLMENTAETHTFAPSNWNIEIRGLCRDCQSSQA